MQSRRERNRAISEALRQEFPDNLVQKKQATHGGVEIDFVPWYYYAQRLNEIEPLNWECEITRVEVVPAIDKNGKDVSKLLMVVQVTINKRTYGGTGTAEAAKQSWGGAHAEAYSQAFRRACAHAGLGLYMYDDQRAETTLPEGVEARPQRHGVTKREGGMDADGDSVLDGDDRGDGDGGGADVASDDDDAPPVGKEGDEEPTDEQEKRLRQLGATGVFDDKELTRWRNSLKRKPTKGNAGRIIREMKTRYESKTGEEFQEPSS